MKIKRLLKSKQALKFSFDLEIFEYTYIGPPKALLKGSRCGV